MLVSLNRGSARETKIMYDLRCQIATLIIFESEWNSDEDLGTRTENRCPCVLKAPITYILR